MTASYSDGKHDLIAVLFPRTYWKWIAYRLAGYLAVLSLLGCAFTVVAAIAADRVAVATAIVVGTLLVMAVAYGAYRRFETWSSLLAVTRLVEITTTAISPLKTMRMVFEFLVASIGVRQLVAAVGELSAGSYSVHGILLRIAELDELAFLGTVVSLGIIVLFVNDLVIGFRRQNRRKSVRARRKSARDKRSKVST